MLSKSATDASMEVERTEEPASMSTLISSSLDRSSVDIDSRSGEDMERLFERECWLRLAAPRRFRVGVGERGTLDSLSGTAVDMVSSEATEGVGSGATGSSTVSSTGSSTGGSAAGSGTGSAAGSSTAGSGTNDSGVTGFWAATVVSILISRLRRLRRRLLPPPLPLPLPLLRGRVSSTGSSLLRGRGSSTGSFLLRGLIVWAGSSLLSVEAERMDTSSLGGWSSRVDIESFGVCRRRGFDSGNTSGVRSSQASSLLAKAGLTGA
jgi:hypothetical protein